MAGILEMLCGPDMACQSYTRITLWALFAIAVMLIVVGVVAGINASNDGYEGLSATSADVTDLDCDIRIGCNGRDLTQREVTEILLNRSQTIEADRDRAAYQAMMQKGNKEGFDLSLYQPGVDRPYIAALQVDRKLRSEDLIEGLTGRAHSDYVFQQFGNDGTVINPAVNPLFRPARHIVGVPPPPESRY